MHDVTRRLVRRAPPALTSPSLLSGFHIDRHPTDSAIGQIGGRSAAADPYQLLRLLLRIPRIPPYCTNAPTVKNGLNWLSFTTIA